MPSLKRDVSSAPDRTGFEAYSGPTPKQQGLYRAEVKQFDYKKFKSGAIGFRLLVELAAPEGNARAEFDGFPLWVNIVFGDKEAMQAREKALYKAWGNTDGKPNIKLGEGDIDNDDNVKVISIDGKKTIGSFVKVDLQQGTYQGESRMEGDGIYRSIDDAPGGSGAASAVKVVVAEDEDEDLLEDGEEEVSFEERTSELKKMGIVDLRKLANGDYDIETKGVKKPELIEAILDQEFGAAALADDEDEEDEEVEIDDTEEEEEEGEEEDEEDEEEEDESEARLAELLELDRTGIKAALKAADPAFKVLKKHTDEELAQAVVDAEFGDEGDDDEEGEPPF